ncbi:pseudouridine synthase [Vogesella oryzae]|uniref:pseudouridine synthase n=1 Tax=Vogesella oryzae TaxID=1735285 RepID=UPI00158255F7|nr:pseudouridine synthase [Vogesella oryzae]
MSKGQRNNSRQPLARVRGQESGQSRNPHPPRGPRGLSSLNAPATPRAKPAANVGRSAPHADSRGPAAPAPKRRSADGATAPAPVQHERRFGNKNAAMPAPAGEQPAGEFGKARREHTGGKVQRAKKLALRAPNQKVVDRSQRLRETRVDMDDIEPVRLQKALAASGVGSRREMEEWIEAGFVTVNGKKASLGDKVGPRDRVMVKGDNIKLKWADRLPRVIMYHKQEGEIVTRDDPERRVTVFDRLPQAKSSRWVAIGRLDVNTSGLLLITTSGELANRMMHPSFEFDREYSVRVLGELTREQMSEMTRGVELEDGPAVFQRVSEKGGAEDGANRWYNVVIREGRNREVRRMFEHFGLTVSRLIRVRFGNIGLPPRLKRGQYYELNESEVAAVMKWAGLTATGQEAPARGGKRAPR